MTLVIGEHVPWNAAWTGEERYEIRSCRYADGRLALWMPYRPGDGRPVFAKPHMVRQRRSVKLMLCTVCGEHTPEDDRWWFKNGHFAEGHFMTTEAPVHRRCADHALKVCPHLRGQPENLERFPKGWDIAAAIMGGPASDRDFGLTFPRGGVVGHLKFCWPASRFTIDWRKGRMTP